MAQEEWIGGVHAVEALLQHAPERVKRLQIARDAANPRIRAIVQRAQALALPVESVRSETLDRLAGELRHQGIVAFARPRQWLSEQDLPAEAAAEDLWLILDGVTDPHNFGACLRSADAAGVRGVIIARDRSAALTAAAIKVASGAADTVAIYSVSNLSRTLVALQKSGVWVVGLAGDSGQSLHALDLRGPLALVLGSEGEGLRRLTREHCDHLASIPMRGSVGSLNVSVAAGIALFEALRQRRL